MVLVTNNNRMWFVGLAVSLVIFAVVFFTVIQPAQNTANQAVKTGLQQTQQALNQAQTNLKSAGGPSGAAGHSAQKAFAKASKLTSCVVAAGTSVSKVAACQARYGN